MGHPSNLPKRANERSLSGERETNTATGSSIFTDHVRQLTVGETLTAAEFRQTEEESHSDSKVDGMKNITAAIDGVYDEMRFLITRQAGKPGLRDALRPLREKLRSLQSREAEEISEQYDSQFRPIYEEAQALIQQARQALGKR